jgi:hypothetical protein
MDGTSSVLWRKRAAGAPSSPSWLRDQTGSTQDNEYPQVLDDTTDDGPIATIGCLAVRPESIRRSLQILCDGEGPVLPVLERESRSPLHHQGIVGTVFQFSDDILIVVLTNRSKWPSTTSRNKAPRSVDNTRLRQAISYPSNKRGRLSFMDARTSDAVPTTVRSLAGFHVWKRVSCFCFDRPPCVRRNQSNVSQSSARSGHLCRSTELYEIY